MLACQIAMEKISLLYVNYNFNEFYTFFTTFILSSFSTRGIKFLSKKYLQRKQKQESILGLCGKQNQKQNKIKVYYLMFPKDPSKKTL